MQNKGAIWVFTVLLTLACLYQLSFSFFTSRFENKAEEYAQEQLDSLSRADGEPDLLARTTLLDQYKTEYLRRNGNEEIYPVFGYTYSEAKSKEINLGLDLAGGMSVTLEVSIPDLILALSNDPDNAELQAVVTRARELQRESQDDFISLFGRAWDETQQGKQMATFFHSRENAERFPADASNGAVLETLREEARVAINNTEKILRTRIDKFGVAQPTIQKQQFTGRILIELPGVKDKERVRKVIQSTANLEFWNTYENAEILPFLDEANTFLADEAGVLDADTATATGDTLLDALSTNEAADALLENAGDTTATAEADTAQSDEDLLSQLAGDSAGSDLDTTASLSEEEQLARLPLFRYLNPNFFNNQVSPGPIVGFANVADTARVNALLNREDIKDLFPEDLRLLWAARPDERISNTALALYAIKADTREGQAPLSGGSIVDAAQSYDLSNQVEVTMTMDSEGARTWRRLTADAAAQNPKRSIAIVLDNLVYTAPQVQGEIPGGRSSISMGTGTRNEQIEEALDLANLLKAGALPAPASIVDEAVVGPSLGQSNIDAGILSFAIALAVVMLYMILYYNSAGLIADIALVANLFFLIGALASIQASLTLPGIAGIILTIGMAVDANVLIFERVREELRNGESAKSALQKGYSMAYSAIIDSNLTTLLTAIVLVTVGTGPIKGFATTLIIGIFTSLFSALFITRLIFVSRMEKGKSFKFWTGWSEKVLLNANYQFIARRKTFYIISAVIILAGVASMFTRGFNLGVDFAGGRTYTVKFENPVVLEQVRSSLGTAFVDDAGNSIAPEVKTIGAQNQIKVTTKYLVDDDSQSADGRVEEALRGGLDGLGNAYTIEESRKVDPTISDDFQASSLTAITLSLLLIFAYIVFRFKRWQYGVGAVLSMIHDVLIVLGFYSIFWGILPFSLEIDQAFIAAILTVVGYSINDTVIVFDRIREYRKDHPTEVSESVINKALNTTLTRTINTSLTTIVVLLIMFLLGGDSIRGFVFALLIGVAVGTFSSLFVAAPVVVDLDNRIKAKGDIK